MQLQCADFWHTLLEQQCSGLKHRVRHKTLLHRLVQQQVGERQKRHALVMGHERADHHAGLAAWQSRCGVVDGFVKAILSSQSAGSKPLQVGAGGRRRHHQRQRGRIRCDHQIVGQSAFEAETRHAERSILVVQCRVDQVVT